MAISIFDNTFLRQTFIGLIYESFIIALFLLLVGFTIHHYLRKRTLYTRIMLLIFVFFSLGIIFSWLAKLLTIVLYDDYYNDISPLIPGYWLIQRITAFRVSFAWMVFGTYCTFYLKMKIFDAKPSQFERIFILTLSVVTFLFSLIFVQNGNVLLDVIAFLLAFLVMTFVYIPFVIASLRLRRSLEEPLYRRAAMSLAVMGGCFILILFCFLLDRIWMFTGLDLDGYTVFYFAAWFFGILGTAAAYYGYILPGQQQKFSQTSQAISNGSIVK
jgi:hypothetical protein